MRYSELIFSVFFTISATEVQTQEIDYESSGYGSNQNEDESSTQIRTSTTTSFTTRTTMNTGKIITTIKTIIPIQNKEEEIGKHNSK